MSRKRFSVKLNSFPDTEREREREREKAREREREREREWVGVALLQTDLILSSSGGQIRFQPHVLGIPYERRKAALEIIQVLGSQTVGVCNGFLHRLHQNL